MKKNRFSEFFKGKGYYVLLFVGVIAIAAVAIIGSNLSSQNNDGNDFVDLNDEPDNNIAAEDNQSELAENNQASDEIVNPKQDNLAEGADTNDTTDQVVDNDSLLEYDVFTEAEEEGIDLAKEPTATTQDKPAEVAEEETVPDAIETNGTKVQAESRPVLDSLTFNKDKGLLWPVNGNVIMNYSMDHTIYHATLMLYKCNPAVIIDAEVGTEVKAAAKGIVTKVEWNEETGHTVTTAIGDGYSLIYGQLDEDSLKVKVGDKLNEGEVIGAIAKPTKYYSVEGSNLYFMVLKDEKTVNPMLLLR
ncbi:MAG: M23 family metallopeptidase [Clostridiales bacterium]|nr:M23 family metallopeptidase [Clostridiales bacterium]